MSLIGMEEIFDFWGNEALSILGGVPEYWEKGRLRCLLKPQLLLL